MSCSSAYHRILNAYCLGIWDSNERFGPQCSVSASSEYSSGSSAGGYVEEVHPVGKSNPLRTEDQTLITKRGNKIRSPETPIICMLGHLILSYRLPRLFFFYPQAFFLLCFSDSIISIDVSMFTGLYFIIYSMLVSPFGEFFISNILLFSSINFHSRNFYMYYSFLFSVEIPWPLPSFSFCPWIYLK